MESLLKTCLHIYIYIYSIMGLFEEQKIYRSEKMNMKKVIAVVLAAATVLSLAGCGNNEPPALTGDPTSKADGTSSKAGTSTVGSPSSAPESTSSTSESELAPIDWSSVPEIDEMDMDYAVIEGENLSFTYNDDYPVKSETKDKYKNGIAVIKAYYGNAEYIKIPETISGKSLIVVASGVDWGGNAKAIKFPEGLCCGISIRSGNGFGYWGSGTGFAINAVSISLPDSLLYIKDFGVVSLETLTLPKSLKVIGGGAFEGDKLKKLKKIDLPSGLEVIGTLAFYQSHLEEITLPSGLKEIGGDAFNGCRSLKKVDIPDSVTKIGQRAFKGCEGIEISYKGKTYNEKNVEKLYAKDLSTM